METRIVNIHDTKTHLSELLGQALAGDEVIIAKANKPLIRLVPLEPRRRNGCFDCIKVKSG